MNRMAAALLCAAALVVSACGDDEPAADPGRAAAERFLDTFVAGDGRVVRRDQGGDTVSEGQAYALLVAVELGDEQRFDRVWAWTREHLQRRDGLLSWRWSDGKVTDEQPAADGDLDAAHALSRAAARFDRPELRQEAERIAYEALWTEAEDGLVLAGPWARDRGVVNPSYLDPAAYDALDQPRAADRAREAIGTLLDAGRLVPDWARLRDGRVVAAGPLDGSERPQYGYEAVRAPLRLAAACDDAAARRLAARMWPALRDEPGRLPRALDGRPTGGESTPGLVAAAAAAAAAGEQATADRLLRQADEAEQDRPTYFGSALLALAHTAWSPRC